MAALSRAGGVRVRAAVPGEGTQVAALWRELWEVHEQWGGYSGSRDERVYADVATRLDEDARLRAGRTVLGRHAHLVADLGGVPCGQVEGWLEAQEGDPSVPTCEVRSLIVSHRARRSGAGRALLDALERAAREICGGRCVLAAEVLWGNPANAFYERVGFEAVAWNARIEARGAVAPGPPFHARLASPEDGVAPATVVVVDAAGVPRGTATFGLHALEPPFVPVWRAILGRFALDEDLPASCLVGPLVALARHLASLRAAPYVELTDLSAPGTELYDAVLATGASAWSRLYKRPA